MVGAIDLIQGNHGPWAERNFRLEELQRQYSAADPQPQPQPQPQPAQQQQNIQQNNFMDMELYKAAMKGDVEKFLDVLDQLSKWKMLSPASILFDQLSPFKNTCLHVGARFGHRDLVGFIAFHFPSLLPINNLKGDTALHVAVRAGHMETVYVLVQIGEDSLSRNTSTCSSASSDAIGNRYYPWNWCSDRLLRATNKEGNTPLHELLLMNPHGNYEVVRYFTDLDNQVPFSENKEGKSPFYIVVESGDLKNFELMLEILCRNGPSILRGKSPVLAAIRGRHKSILARLLDLFPELAQVKDEGREIPLHCATSIGYLEGVSYMIRNFKEGIFGRDDRGFLPIHIASKKGHVDIVRLMLQHCPYWRELLTEQGHHNILHLAAKSGKNNVVDYILKSVPNDLKIELANEKDDDGNTPLHLAAKNCHPKIVSSLTWDKGVNLELVNCEGMTALDIAGNLDGTDLVRKRLIGAVLKSAATESTHSKFPKQKSTSSSLEHEQHTNNGTSVSGTLMLVSTLVATVTFAAGFTMPGGYNNTYDPNQGMATMLTKKMFQIFVICDAVAMYSSIIAVVSLIWAQLGSSHLVYNSICLAGPMLGLALSMMSVAFMAGVSLVISNLNWLENLILAMGIAFLAITSALYVPLFIPLASYRGAFRHISYYYFSCLMMMIISGSYTEDDDKEDD